MPADYESTARALALPISPPPSPSGHNGTQPPWTRRQSSHGRNRKGNTGAGRFSFVESALTQGERIWRRGFQVVERMTPIQQGLVILGGLVVIVLSILFFVFSGAIFAWLEPIAEKWKNLRGGWLIIWALVFATAFPPVIGYSTCLTLAGFVYGFPLGWPIVASATIAGSTCSFLVSRTILSGFVGRLVAQDKKFEALSLVLKHDGLKLLIMIRLCPLPYSLSNGAISTFPTVSPLMFGLATAAATPKLLIAVFVGSRLALIAKSGEKMDAGTKAINWISIIIGVSLGVATGWLIYTRTLARSRQLESENRGISRQTSAQSPEFADEIDDVQADPAVLRNDQIDFIIDGDDDANYMDDIEDSNDRKEHKYATKDEEASLGNDGRKSYR